MSSTSSIAKRPSPAVQPTKKFTSVIWCVPLHHARQHTSAVLATQSTTNIAHLVLRIKPGGRVGQGQVRPADPDQPRGPVVFEHKQRKFAVGTSSCPYSYSTDTLNGNATQIM